MRATIPELRYRIRAGHTEGTEVVILEVVTPVGAILAVVVIQGAADPMEAAVIADGTRRVTKGWRSIFVRPVLWVSRLRTRKSTRTGMEVRSSLTRRLRRAQR